jgi:hypothetical protein
MDRLQNGVDVLCHFIVPKADNAIALALQPPRALRISRSFGAESVLRTINLDDQPRGHASKVRNVGTYRYLTPEMSTEPRRAPQVLPQTRFDAG